VIAARRGQHARRPASCYDALVQAIGKDVRELLSLLAKHGAKHMVVGGFAVAAHGFPRYTKDLDVWLECSAENARRVLAARDEFGFGSLGLTTVDFETPDLKIGGRLVPVIDRHSLAINKRAFGRPQDLADAEELER
jgi:hypothetical protein